MTRQLDIERILDSFLADGAHQLADHVLDAALTDIDNTRQRRSWWPTSRFDNMNVYAKVAIAAAAVLVVAVLGYNLLPGISGPGGQSSPSPVVTPTPSPTPVPTIPVVGDGPLPAGTVVAHVGPEGSMDATLTVPEGWRGFAGGCLLPLNQLNAQGVGLCFLDMAGLHSDPCHGYTEAADIAVGPTVEDFATALSEQTAYEATTPTDVTLAGYSGKRLDLHLPTDVASCDDGAFYPWAGSIYAQGPDNLWHVWILDVEGERVVIASNYFAATSAEDQTTLQAIVDSIQITP